VQPPRVTATRIVYENRWMRLHEDITERADGTPGLYAWIEKPPAAVIVPLDDDHVWLVQQHRHPIGARFWELPQGAWEDDPTAAPEDLARGELAEETGLRAGRIERLGRLFFAYGMSDQ
jgi:8-oxo-dGTP pyrophosphatase MutT (NUDIX family)